jgi:hypothetical protein
MLTQAVARANGYEYIFIGRQFKLPHVSSIDGHFAETHWRKLGPKTAGHCLLAKKEGDTATITVSTMTAPKYVLSEIKGLYKRFKHKSDKYLDVLVRPFFTKHVDAKLVRELDDGFVVQFCELETGSRFKYEFSPSHNVGYCKTVVRDHLQLKDHVPIQFGKLSCPLEVSGRCNMLKALRGPKKNQLKMVSAKVMKQTTLKFKKP